ncbi:MAG: hypothetical protein ABEJ28_05270 [Salinigranum sp.]
MSGLSTVPAHLPASGRLLPDVVLLAGLGSLTLLALAVAAFRRRRSRPYLLVVLALSTLLVKSLLGALTVARIVPSGVHHLTEHGLDAAMAAFLLAAVYYVRDGPPTDPEERDR